MEYLDCIISILQKVNKTQKHKMEEAGKIVADTIKKGGIIYLFGCGHSHLLALDCFYRAGGLANVYPILNGKLMLHESASYSSYLEKKEESVKGLLDKYNITSKDCLFVMSTSGKNGAPVQMAIDGLSKGVKVVGVLSSEYFSDMSKHSSGKLLKDVCTVYIDNLAPHGDATQEINGTNVKSAPASTVVSSYIMQNVMLIGERLAVKNGASPDIFLSGNIEGGAEYNKALIEKYKPLIDCL